MNSQRIAQMETPIEHNGISSCHFAESSLSKALCQHHAP
jgi:hypothetical protein